LKAGELGLLEPKGEDFRRELVAVADLEAPAVRLPPDDSGFSVGCRRAEGKKRDAAKEGTKTRRRGKKQRAKNEIGEIEYVRERQLYGCVRRAKREGEGKGGGREDRRS